MPGGHGELSKAVQPRHLLEQLLRQPTFGACRHGRSRRDRCATQLVARSNGSITGTSRASASIRGGRRQPPSLAHQHQRAPAHAAAPRPPGRSRPPARRPGVPSPTRSRQRRSQHGLDLLGQIGGDADRVPGPPGRTALRVTACANAPRSALTQMPRPGSRAARSGTSAATGPDHEADHAAGRRGRARRDAAARDVRARRPPRSARHRARLLR